MTYKVVLAPLAARQIKKLPINVQDRVRAKLRDLADDPRPDGVKKLEPDTSYRIRAGSYRIIYKIEDDILLVTVVRVGHRREVYK